MVSTTGNGQSGFYAENWPKIVVVPKIRDFLATSMSFTFGMTIMANFLHTEHFSISWVDSFDDVHIYLQSFTKKRMFYYCKHCESSSNILI